MKEPERTLQELTPLLVEVVYPGLEVCTQRAVEFFLDLKELLDRDLYPNLVRYHLKQHLTNAGYVAKDETEGPGAEVLSNNGLEFKDGLRRIRLRKSWDHRLPSATTIFQRNFYQQQKLFDDGQPVLNLIALWDADSSGRFLGLSLVKPRGSGKLFGVSEWVIRVPSPAELVLPVAEQHIEDLPIVGDIAKEESNDD